MSHNKQPNVLIIIPARGGSKGIPRKNLRSLAGKPLIFYAIKNALSLSFEADIYVSSDDEEILSIAKKLKTNTIFRNKEDAKDETTLDPVIYKAYQHASKEKNKNYDIIVTLQPTSPLLKTNSLEIAINNLIKNKDTDTIISATNDTHLTWGFNKKENNYFPNYRERVNRQKLPPNYKETGGFLITRQDCLSLNNRIGKNVELYILSDKESIDIDNHADWSLCEFFLKRKLILFVTSGYNEIGLGHIYNTLLIANDILEHEIKFLVDKKSQLAYEKISSKNYTVNIQSQSCIIDDIKKIAPDIIINDRLDTEKEHIQKLKSLNYKIINFEDLGSGAQFADLTINAIYPEKEIISNHYFGHKYFILRDEFLLTEKHNPRTNVKNILLSFGGVDPNNFTHKVINSIYEICQKKDIKINVITGFGYQKHETIKHFKNINVYKNVNNISDYMQEADIIFTSAGRTTYEVASINTPSIVLAQNERELTHLFANIENGFINLGLGSDVNTTKIKNVFLGLVNNYAQRLHMSQLMSKCDLSQGRKKVNSLITQVINS